MTQPTALIVEDDVVQAEIFEHVFNGANYEPTVIKDGQEAIDYLTTAVPDIILLDLHLPEVTGEDILRFIRTNEQLKDIRVIVASADGTMAEQLAYKPDLVLNKPVSVFQLQHLVKRFHPSRE